MKHEGIELYEREIDDGHGIQQVIVEDGIVIKQELVSKGAGYYTGDGNPELVGRKIDNVKRKYHLRKRKLSEEDKIRLLEELYVEEQEKMERKRRIKNEYSY